MDKTAGKERALRPILVSIAGVIWTLMAIAITSSAPDFGPFKVAKFVFPAFGVAFIIFGILMSMHMHRKAKEFRRASREYRRQRDRLSRD